jgi:hypothetical protein
MSKRKRTGRTHFARNARGSQLLEGVSGFYLLLFTFVLLLILLLNVGTLTYYKMKLSLVTTRAAAYASSIIYPSSASWLHNQQRTADLTVLSAQSTAYANTLLQQAGLAAPASQSPPQVTVTYGPLVADTLSANVAIKLTSLPIFGRGIVLPAFMALQDSAFGVARYDQPPGVLCLVAPGTPPNSVSSVYMPGYGWAPDGGAGAAPNDVMRLRTNCFSHAPQIIPLGVPSAGSIGECWDSGGSAMTPLPSVTQSY